MALKENSGKISKAKWRRRMVSSNRSMVAAKRKQHRSHAGDMKQAAIMANAAMAARHGGGNGAWQAAARESNYGA